MENVECEWRTAERGKEGDEGHRGGDESARKKKTITGKEENTENDGKDEEGRNGRRKGGS